MQVNSRRAALGLIAVLSLTPAAIATTRYVNESCENNTHTGLEPNCLLSNGRPNPNGPKARLLHTLLVASDGDVIEVASGEYFENELEVSDTLIIRHSGDPQDCILNADAP